MRFLSLFAGIGAFDLGCERAGWTCAGQVEIDPFCQRVLAKHWPNVPRWSDVRNVQAADVVARCGKIDAIIGGFPCQPWSVAGKGKGADDPRHLWPEYARLIRELRPRWVIGENVPGLRGRGADLVLGDLEALGYTCWPLVVGADDVGASHRRKRIWIVAHAASIGWREGRAESEWQQRRLDAVQRGADVAHAMRDEPAGWGGAGDLAGAEGTTQSVGSERQRMRDASGDRGANVADASGEGLPGRRGLPSGAEQGESATSCCGWPMGNADGLRQPQPQGSDPDLWRWPSYPGQEQHDWEEPRTTQSAVGGAVDGPARRLARWRRAAFKAIGNAVVPQVAEIIARGVTKAGRQ